MNMYALDTHSHTRYRHAPACVHTYAHTATPRSAHVCRHRHAHRHMDTNQIYTQRDIYWQAYMHTHISDTCSTSFTQYLAPKMKKKCMEIHRKMQS